MCERRWERLKTVCTHTVSDRWGRVRQRETAVRFHAKANNNTTETMDRHSSGAASGGGATDSPVMIPI